VIFKLSLPSVGEKTLGKELFAECCICDTRQRALCRVSKKDTRQRNSLPSVKNKTLGKELLRRVFSFTEGFLCGTRQRALCRVPEIKHSAKNMTLGKEPNSGSDRLLTICPNLQIQLDPKLEHQENVYEEQLIFFQSCKLQLKACPLNSKLS
jgi:hypothetical protein